MYSIIETQLPIEGTKKQTQRIYRIDGPSFTTIDSFWQHLVDNNVIESYTIWEGEIK
jgi:hypothetical protein